MSTKGKSYAKLNITQVVQIAKLLEAHCKTDGEYCAYEDGWSDEKIAEIVLPNYSGNGAASVARRRIELGYGRFLQRGPYKKDKPQDDSLVFEMVNKLAARSEALIAQIEALKARIDALEAKAEHAKPKVQWRPVTAIEMPQQNGRSV